MTQQAHNALVSQLIDQLRSVADPQQLLQGWIDDEYHPPEVLDELRPFVEHEMGPAVKATEHRLFYLAGETVGGYELEERIYPDIPSSPALSVVYRAHKANAPQTPYVVKFPHPLYCPAPDALDQSAISREVQHLMALPQIQEIMRLQDHGFWQVPEADPPCLAPYLVTDYIIGSEAITVYASRHQLTVVQRLTLFLKAAYAVQKLHTLGEGKLHCDLKPGNIMVAGNDDVQTSQVWLIDFGMAQWPDRWQQSSHRGGTPGYAAPEQNTVDGLLSVKTDVYALGVILHQLLTDEDTPTHPLPHLSEVHELFEHPDYYDLDAAVAAAVQNEIRERSTLQALIDAAKNHHSAWSNEPYLTIPRRQPEDNPYRGLLTFNEDDHALFFGRSELINDLMERLERQSLLPIIGPSGAGKSSLVLAGLIGKELQQRKDWLVIKCRPQTSPMANLRQALGNAINDSIKGTALDLMAWLQQCLQVQRDKRRVLLFIDQYEELYGPGNEEDRVPFSQVIFQTLKQTTTPLLTVVLTLRTDYLEELGTDANHQGVPLDMADVVRVGPMNARHLAEVIERPAAQLKVTVAPDLLEKLLKEMAQHERSLALLQLLLDRLWAKGNAAIITLTEYDNLGGFEDVLNRYADQVLAQLSSDLEELAHKVLPRLVNVQSVKARERELPDSRSIQPFDAFTEREQVVLEALAKARLVLIDAPSPHEPTTVELVHDKLISEWKTLRDELNNDRRFLHWQQQLEAYTREWLNNDRAKGLLLRHPLLGEAQRYFEERGDELDDTLKRYIQLSLDEDRNAREYELSQMQAIADHQTRSAKRLKIIVGVVTGLIILAIGFAVYAVLQQTATEARRLAEVGLNLAEEGQFDVGILLGLEGNRLLNIPETRNSLINILDSNLHLHQYIPQKHEVRSVTISNNDTLAVGGCAGAGSALRCQQGEIQLWHRNSGSWKLEKRLHGHRGHISSLAFNSDGTKLASASEYDRENNNGKNIIIVWDLQENKRIELLGHRDKILGLTFHPNTNFLLSASWDGKIALWNLDAPDEHNAIIRVTTDIKKLDGENAEVESVEFSPTGNNVAASHKGNGSIVVWDFDNQSPYLSNRRKFSDQKETVDSVAFSPDGNLLASAGKDNNIVLWNVTAGEKWKTLYGHKDWIQRIVFSGTGILASVSWDKTVTIWNIKAGEPLIEPLLGHSSHVMDVAFTADSKSLVSVGSDRRAIVWSIDPRWLLTNHDMHISNDAVWNIVSKELSGTGKYHSSITSLRYSPDSRQLASANHRNNTILLWDTINTNTAPRALKGHQSAIRELAFDPVDGKLASGSTDGEIILWDTSKPNSKLRSLHHGGEITGLSFSRDGKLLGSSGRSKEIVKIWEVVSGTEKRWKLENWRYFALAFSPRDDLLAVTGYEGVAEIWNSKSGEKIATLVGHEHALVRNAIFSPSEDILATSSDFGTIILWDIKAHEKLVSFNAHGTRIHALWFSPDGQVLVSSDSSGKVLLWDMDTYQLRRGSLSGHVKWVDGLAFSPDGRYLATGDGSGKILLRPMAIEDIKRQACQIVGRELSDTERDLYLEFESDILCPKN